MVVEPLKRIFVEEKKEETISKLRFKSSCGGIREVTS